MIKGKNMSTQTLRYCSGCEEIHKTPGTPNTELPHQEAELKELKYLWHDAKVK